MNKLVVLNIDEGSFEQGFPVRLGIGEDGRIFHKNRVTLPPAPEIPRLYQEWQKKYRDLGDNGGNRQIDVPAAQVTRVSIIEDENQARNIFENYLCEWFTQLPWRELRVCIEEKTQPDDFIRVIIDTQNIYLKKLPWHLWQLFQNRPHAEFALSAEYAPPSEPLKRPVNILAIFGGSEGLDLTSDKELIATLSRRGAKVTWLEQPQRQELNESLWNQHWDILFFAGHSSSGEECKTGQIQINDSENISLNRLRNALRTSVKNGLKLAIFNSCDGLGLADELRGLGVPQMIVMREPVPDEVARQFLKYFLEDFSQGHSLYVAARNARQRLEWMEDNFPCASWLPVICQNPAARPLVWAESSMKNLKKWFIGGIAVGLIFTGNYIRENLLKVHNNTPLQTISATSQPNSTSAIKSLENLQDLGDNFSWGEKIVISNNPNRWKQKGIEAFSQKNYKQSIEYFEKSLQQNINDPETLIYLNNAVAMKPSESDKLPILAKANPKPCLIQNPKPVKIAVVAPSFANTTNHINEEILRGVAQAQNQINISCGINGRLLQIVIVDDRDKISTSSRVAKTLADEKDILAVVGHYSSRATIEAAKIYQDKQMVVVSPTSTAVRKSINRDYGITLNKYVFRTPTNDGIAIKDLVNYMVNTLGKTEAAIAYDSNGSYSKTYREELKNQLQSIENGKLINLEECDLFNNANLENCLIKANKTVSVLVLVPETGITYNKALTILNSNNSSNLTLFGGDSLYSKVVKNKGKKVKNLMIPISWLQNQANLSSFEGDAQKLWNVRVNWRTAMSYDAAMAIVEGLKRIDGNLTREKLQKELSKPEFSASGAAGIIQFDENGDRKITPENDAEIGVLVQVKCDANTSNNCKFVRVPQQ
ncbi:MAG: ABC transporter substrate-binding protein [Rivularia sp. (in: Bacteria)]|nr:ABC transporter substrate-binding protein [Rivularia sp. MS3]